MAGGYQLRDSMRWPYFPQEFDYTINGLVLKLPMGHRLPIYMLVMGLYLVLTIHL